MHTTRDITERTPGTMRFDLANMQGRGRREYQQDAFALSDAHDETVETRGLDLLLADGMGGIADGGALAQATVEYLQGSLGQLGLHTRGDDWKQVLAAINSVCAQIYRQYSERGGTTLIACHLAGENLWFASVGDSSIYLLRMGRIFELNRRHEYAFDLFERVFEGTLTISEALSDPQAKALSSFIGCKNLAIDTTQSAFRLKAGDVLLLCSDGISDTLSLEQLRQTMQLSTAECCTRLEQLIEEAALPNQDNYTGIVVRCLPQETLSEVSEPTDKKGMEEDKNEQEKSLASDDDYGDSTGSSRHSRRGFWHRFGHRRK